MGADSKQKKRLIAQNLRVAKQNASIALNRFLVEQLRVLTSNFSFSLIAGDLLLLNGGWYVTHTGLIRLARRCHCCGIQVEQVPALCNSDINRYGLRAIVYKTPQCRGFVGYGDADPSNVSPLVHGAELRVAETRAVNRALRKAYGIGICSVEELGSLRAPSEAARELKKLPPQPTNGTDFGGPKVRDRLCQLIRQHQLDPALVKAYATDFCCVKILRDASREQVEKFVMHLADWAEKDRNALLCQLNSYLGQKQGVA
jgi:hypothetical protein